MATPVFPELYGFSIKKRPRFHTINQIPPSGREVTRFQNLFPFWEFELRAEILRDETQNNPVYSYFANYKELQQLSQLFLACNGQFGVFFFEDTSDNSRTEQYLGTGDGTETDFLFKRTISYGDLTFTEPVGGVNLTESIVVYVDGVVVPQIGNWAISSDSTTLVFTVAPADGAQITASFYYYYLCRFITDEMDFDQFSYNRWQVEAIRFRSVLPDGIEDLNPLMGISNWGNQLCLTDFRWVLSHSFDVSGNAVDVNGSYYVSYTGPAVDVITPGRITYTFDVVDVWDAIDNWFGSAIVNRGAEGPLYATPIYQGQYVLIYTQANSNPNPGATPAHWYAIAAPIESSGLTILGAIWYNDGLTGAPYTPDTLHICGICNNQELTDPILFISAFAVSGSATWCLGLIPSINDIIAGRYMEDGYNSLGPCKVPPIIYYPISNTDFSAHTFSIGGAGPTGNIKAGFTLPAADGGTNLYFYLSRGFMDSNSSGVSVNQEVVNVLFASDPLGCMIKIALGTIDYETEAAIPNNHTTPHYTVDNSNWQTPAGADNIPFTDEYTYISNGNSGGEDTYCMQTGFVIKRTTGSKWWILYYMPGVDDANANTGKQMYDRIKIFEYDPATEISILRLETECIVHTNPNLGFTTELIVGDDNQNFWAQQDSFGKLTLTILSRTTIAGGFHRIYKDDFFSFTSTSL